jgi:hypothetical protein
VFYTSTTSKPSFALTTRISHEVCVPLGRIERALGITLEREVVEGFAQPKITAPKPIKLFSSGFSRASRNRPARSGLEQLRHLFLPFALTRVRR